MDENEFTSSLKEPALPVSPNPSRAALTPVQPIPAGSDTIYVHRIAPLHLPSTDKQLQPLPSSNDSEPSTGARDLHRNPTFPPKGSSATAPVPIASSDIPCASPSRDSPVPVDSSAPGILSPVEAQEGPTCSKYGELLTAGQQYHDRVWHQQKMTINNSKGKTIIQHCMESGLFTCPLCEHYDSRDPVRIRVWNIFVASFFLGHKSEKLA